MPAYIANWISKEEGMSFVERMVYKFAHFYSRRLPKESTLELEDFAQAARVAVLEKEPNYDPDRAKFTTYVYYAVRKRCQEMLRAEYQYHGLNVGMEPIQSIGAPGVDPDRMMRVNQAIQILIEEAPQLADLIIAGVPDDLLFYAKADLKDKCSRLGRDIDNCSIIVNRKLLSDYYGISEKRLKQLARKTRELVQ